MVSWNKPLPLKQRTSSVDQRRDFSMQTWTSLLGLLKAREFLITVDHFSIWRRHLAWAMENGDELRDYMTKRYATSMVFMSLLLSTELSVLFNSATETSEVRRALLEEEHDSISFWVGIFIILSAVLAILSLISTFTAWSMVSAVNKANVHCIFRSAIGQYAAELPGRFIVSSIYAFLVWVTLFFFLLLPVGIFSIVLMMFVAFLFVHTIAAFSSFGRVIMHTGAMGSQRIFAEEYEETLLPHSLHQNLLLKARVNLKNKTSIMRQYRTQKIPIDRIYSEPELSRRLSDRLSDAVLISTMIEASSSSVTSDDLDTNKNPPPLGLHRKRTESLVKFSDGYDTSGNRIFDIENPTNLDTMPGSRESSVTSQSTRSSSSRSSQQENVSGNNMSQTVNSTEQPAGNPGGGVDASLFEKWLSSGNAELGTPPEPRARKSLARARQTPESSNSKMRHCSAQQQHPPPTMYRGNGTDAKSPSAAIYHAPPPPVSSFVAMGSNSSVVVPAVDPMDQHLSETHPLLRSIPRGGLYEGTSSNMWTAATPFAISPLAVEALVNHHLDNIPTHGESSLSEAEDNDNDASVDVSGDHASLGTDTTEDGTVQSCPENEVVGLAHLETADYSQRRFHR